MLRHTSLLFLSSLLSASFPSIGWTQICFSDRPTCTLRCPTVGGIGTVHMTCKEHSTYIACNDRHHSLPTISQCECPQNSIAITRVIHNKASLKGVNIPIPAYEVTCVLSNQPVSPSAPSVPSVPSAINLSPKIFSPQPSPTVSPSTSPPVSHTPSVAPPPNTPQPLPPSNGGATANVLPIPKPAPKPIPSGPKPKPKHASNPKHGSKPKHDSKPK